MRAVWYEHAGRAQEVLQFGEMEDPAPGTDEVRVRLDWSAVNPTDVKRRQTGRELGVFDRIIPNNDGSGVIETQSADTIVSGRVGEWLKIGDVTQSGSYSQSSGASYSSGSSKRKDRIWIRADLVR